MAAFVDFQELKERVSIEQVITMLGLKMKRSGAQLRGACPACNAGGDRALAVTIERSSFYCFSERKGGDQLALASHVLALKPREAAEQIAKHFGLDSSSTAPPAPRTAAPTPTLGMAPLDYLDPLASAVEALGITPVTADLVGIGYADKGTMKGRVLIPIRMPDGTLIGYCGIALDHERQFLFPDNLQDRAEGKVVPLRRKA